MKKLMKTLLALAVCAALLALAACGGGGQKSKVDAIKEAGKLVVYTNPEFPPYEFVEGTEVVGVDMEIAKAIAARLEVELEIVSAEFDGIVASIASGKGDLGISGFTITEERKAQVSFSAPYVDSVQYIIVPQDSDIHYMEELEGLSVGGQQGTTGFMFVETEMAEGVLVGKDVDLKAYNSAPSAMLDLDTGRLDAVVIDELVAIALVEENPAYKAVPFTFASGDAVTEQYGVAVHKDNADLLAVVDEVVSELVETGKIDEFFAMYE